MVSTNLEQALPEFDEVITRQDYYGFAASGLKETSVIRIGRLAVVEAELLLGEIGEISNERLNRIQKHIVDWIMGAQDPRSEV